MRSFSPTLALGAILLTSFSGVSLLAQDQQQPPASTSQAAPLTQPRHAPNPQRHAKKMARKLGLTPDQEARLEPILADKQQQMESAKADTTTGAERQACQSPQHQSGQRRKGRDDPE